MGGTNGCVCCLITNFYPLCAVTTLLHFLFFLIQELCHNLSLKIDLKNLQPVSCGGYSPCCLWVFELDLEK